MLIVQKYGGTSVADPDRINAKGEGMVFTDIHEVHRAYGSGHVSLHAKIKVRLRTTEFDEDGKVQERYGLIETTVGRALMSELLPEGLSFDLVNRDMTKKAISGLINACYRRVGLKETVIFADQLMYMGFSYATRAAVSFGINDMTITDKQGQTRQREFIILRQDVKDGGDQNYFVYFQRPPDLRRRGRARSGLRSLGTPAHRAAGHHRVAYPRGDPRIRGVTQAMAAGVGFCWRRRWRHRFVSW